MKRKTTSSNYLNQSFLSKKCPLNRLIYLMGKRWVTEVFCSIDEGNIRFSTIKSDLKLISDHVLANRLQLLERNHFISKKIFDEIPLRVEYTLTRKGTELSSILDKLCDFAERVSLAQPEKN